MVAGIPSLEPPRIRSALGERHGTNRLSSNLDEQLKKDCRHQALVSPLDVEQFHPEFQGASWWPPISSVMADYLEAVLRMHFPIVATVNYASSAHGAENQGRVFWK